MVTTSAQGKLSRKERISIIYMPILVVALTAVLGTGIGAWLQNRSFRKNELFKARLERIMAGQEEAVEVLRQVDDARRQIRSNEDFIRHQIDRLTDATRREEARQYYQERDYFGPSVALLKEARSRVGALSKYAETLSPNSVVPDAIEVFVQSLDDFLICIANNIDFERSCSDENPDVMETVQGIIVAHAVMADSLIEEFE